MPQLSPSNLTKPRRQNSLLQVCQILKISLVLISKTSQQNKARIDALCKIPYAYACPKTPKNHKTSAMQADIDRCDAKSVYALQKASGR